MWNYEKRLEYPVNISTPNPKIAQVILTQFGGPDGELSASMRYLAQRYTMPYRNVAGLLTDIGTEELAHMEMICAIVHQLTRNLTPEEIMASGFDKYYVDHTLALWPQAAAGIPHNSCEFQSKGDPITDLMEDMAAEQKARSTYDNILRLVKDPEVCDPIRFLRQREVVHFQRFGDTKLTDLSKNRYKLVPMPVSGTDALWKRAQVPGCTHAGKLHGACTPSTAGCAGLLPKSFFHISNYENNHV